MKRETTCSNGWLSIHPKSLLVLAIMLTLRSQISRSQSFRYDLCFTSQMLLHETLIKKWTQAREVVCVGTVCGRCDVVLEPAHEKATLWCGRWVPQKLLPVLAWCHCIPGVPTGPVAAVLSPARVNAASRSSAGQTDCWLLPRAVVMVTFSVTAEAEWV